MIEMQEVLCEQMGHLAHGGVQIGEKNLPETMPNVGVEGKPWH